MCSNVKRTYASRPRKFPSSPRTSSPPRNSSQKRKQVLLDCVSINVPPPKRANNIRGTLNSKPKPISANSKLAATKNALPQSSLLAQLHFVIDSALRTCPLCSLSYIKGAIDDEVLHKRHCTRVQRGLEWGKEEDKEAQKAGVRVIQDFLKFKGTAGVTRGRIIAVPADAGGKIGSKLTSLLETINLALSSPALLPRTLKCSKVYIFLIPSPSGVREHIAGCVVAQRITSAMNVVPACSTYVQDQNLVEVDGGLYCSPQLYPTPLGIPRLFVPLTHRRQGIATLLLAAAARTFVHGYELDPSKGDVAFSQPTSDGRKVMESWGKGGVRVYHE